MRLNVDDIRIRRRKVEFVFGHTVGAQGDDGADAVGMQCRPARLGQPGGCVRTDDGFPKGGAAVAKAQTAEIANIGATFPKQNSFFH